MAGLPVPAREHQAAGKTVEVRGQRIFIREEGDGPPVLLLHGVPSSSFLYRKMMTPLAGQGFRAVAFDFPGMGLSGKPAGAPYDWHTLAGWVDAVVEALGIAPVHLVAHDIGGPIGFEWAIKHGDKVRSLTIMNTILDVAVFKRPFPMWLYCVPVVRQIMMLTQNTVAFMPIMRKIGVKHRESVTFADVASYLALLAHDGGRQPFLDIMSGFDLSPAHGRFLLEGLKKLKAPMQLVWGEHEIAIPRHQVETIQQHLPLKEVHWVDARHFLQEDRPEDCARHVAAFCKAADGGGGN